MDLLHGLRRLFGRGASRRSSAAGRSADKGGGRSAPRRRRSVTNRSRIEAAGGMALGMLPYFLIACAAASLPLLGYKGYMLLLTSPHFAITECRVSGNQRVSDEEIIKASGLRLGDNILSMSESDVEERLRAMGWMKGVKVGRDFPHAVEIEVEERIPVATLVEKKTYMVDVDGNLFKEMAPEDFDPSLLVLAGIEASRLKVMGEERQLSETVRESLTAARGYRSAGLDKYYPLAEVHFDEIIGYSLVARSGQRFVLGFGDFSEKMDRLATVLADLERRQSPVSEVRLDNEKEPRRVTVSGAKVQPGSVRTTTVAPAASSPVMP